MNPDVWGFRLFPNGISLADAKTLGSTSCGLLCPPVVSHRCSGNSCFIKYSCLEYVLNLEPFPQFRFQNWYTCNWVSFSHT